jgi:hypothetical protein
LRHVPSKQGTVADEGQDVSVEQRWREVTQLPEGHWIKPPEHVETAGHRSALVAQEESEQRTPGRPETVGQTIPAGQSDSFRLQVRVRGHRTPTSLVMGSALHGMSVSGASSGHPPSAGAAVATKAQLPSQHVV